MSKRRKAREVVLQALYEVEFSDQQWQAVLGDQLDRRDSRGETVEYAHTLMQLVCENRDELDGMIEGALENWELERVSLVDKNVLRLALAELRFSTDVPMKVVINEAVDIANKYSTSDAGRFVNGILDRLARLQPDRKAPDIVATGEGAEEKTRTKPRDES